MPVSAAPESCRLLFSVNNFTQVDQERRFVRTGMQLTPEATPLRLTAR